MMPDCVGRLTKIFAEKLLVEVESPETDLLDTGILDSMSFVELLLNLELEFGFRVEMETLDMENFRSIARIAELVESARRDAEVASQSA
jgi:acyl carrier protein